MASIPRQEVKKVTGLDPIRFVLAFVVLLGHGALPQVSDELAAQSHWWYCLKAAGVAVMPTGVAAVMAFFIISGFVIHYPYRNGKSLDVPEFYARRFIRIALPAVAAWLLYRLTFGLVLGVAWSLICELVYYLLYPLVLKCKKYFRVLFVVALVASYASSLLFDLFATGYNGDFHRHGFLLTWVTGFPVWLLGVALADRYDSLKVKATGRPYLRLWVLRIGAWIGGSFTALLRFHFGVAYSYTLPVLSFFLFFWLAAEIAYYKGKAENKALEYGGRISYSIYLVHALALYAVVRYAGEEWWLFLIKIAAALLASWVFYLLVEKPSHRLARAVRIPLRKE